MTTDELIERAIRKAVRKGNSPYDKPSGRSHTFVVGLNTVHALVVTGTHDLRAVLREEIQKAAREVLLEEHDAQGKAARPQVEIT